MLDLGLNPADFGSAVLAGLPVADDRRGLHLGAAQPVVNNLRDLEADWPVAVLAAAFAL